MSRLARSGLVAFTLLGVGILSSVLPLPAHAQNRSAPAPAMEPARGASRTILISIDGFRPDVYLDPAATGLAVPNLIALRDRGVSAERMIGVFPSVTYPSHTTMVTGMQPARHGITSNFKPGTRDWYLEMRDIRVDPLWRVYRRAGRSTAIVTWPASYGADVDWLVPENLSFGIPDVPGAIARGATPGLIAELEKAAGTFDIPSFEAIEAGEKLDRMTGAYAREILRRHRPGLLLLHFLDADHQEHYHGPYSPEARGAFEKIDALIGGLVAELTASGEIGRTNIVIVGDHGFARVHSSLNVSALLADMAPEMGWGPDAKDWPIDLRIDGAGMAIVAKPGQTVDRERIASGLTAQVAHRAPHLARVLTAAELDIMGSYPGALAGLSIVTEGFTLANEPGAALILSSERLQGMHGYLPDLPMMGTGFIAAGPGYRKGYRMPVMRMVDLAPTLAAADGIAFAPADGSAVRGILAQAQ